MRNNPQDVFALFGRIVGLQRAGKQGVKEYGDNG